MKELSKHGWRGYGQGNAASCRGKVESYNNTSDLTEVSWRGSLKMVRYYPLEQFFDVFNENEDRCVVAAASISI